VYTIRIFEVSLDWLLLLLFQIPFPFVKYFVQYVVLCLNWEQLKRIHKIKCVGCVKQQPLKYLFSYLEVVGGLIPMGVVCVDLFDLHPYGKGVESFLR